jgi:hypothetical protein
MNEEQVDLAVAKGLKFLRDKQLSDGGFACLFSQSENCTADALEEFIQGNKKSNAVVETHSVFPASLIGHSLFVLKENQDAQNILDRIADFLVSNRNAFGIWRHYTRAHQFGHLIPNDLDNSAMASHLLKNLGVGTPDNRSLFLSNRAPDGHFYTWITFRLKWNSNTKYWKSLLREFRHPIGQYFFWKYMSCSKNDVDAVVNSNVLNYLGVSEETKPVFNLIREVLEKGKEETCDKWYGRPILVYYFFSKNMCSETINLNSLKSILRDKILANLNEDGSFFTSVLDTSLAIIALENLGCFDDIPPLSVKFLLDSQKNTGSWDKWSIYYGNPDRTAAFGGEEITTGYALEALFRLKVGFFTKEKGSESQ